MQPVTAVHIRFVAVFKCECSGPYSLTLGYRYLICVTTADATTHGTWLLRSRNSTWRETPVRVDILWSLPTRRLSIRASIGIGAGMEVIGTAFFLLGRCRLKCVASGWMAFREALLFELAGSTT